MTEAESWRKFKEYCEIHGINLDHEDDWGDWWNIWKAAVNAERFS